ncbi:MAG: 30S ribosomal protein S20 [Planctomycetaceae bacterium]|nr:30S ribosomal protein S20 [Planctomycetota bacterium]NUN51329.1 30S ribosomal protein S20 [Planctomycetaceae bacterium]
MAHTKSALKRHRQSEKRNLRNRIAKSSVKSQIKKTLAAIEAGDLAMAKEAFRLATQQLDKAAKNRTIHPNEASRRKSRIARRIAALKK